MAKALTITRATYAAALERPQALARAAAQGIIVLSCAAALILAGQPLPL